MQTLGWYVNRLKGMTPAELTWRIRSEARDLVDRGRVAAGWYPPSNGTVAAEAKGFEPGFRVSEVAVGDWAVSGMGHPERLRRDALLERSGRVRNGRLTFFDLQDIYLGDPIDWNRDHDSGKKAPMIFAPSVDYRDYRVTGDAKVVWEPNRHHQLVVLGRAFRATGDVKYAKAVVGQLESWMSQCPFGKGMNWRSPLELAIRLINWVWAVDLIRESGLVDGNFLSRLLHSAYLHIWEITRKYSRGSSANNHLIGEAAGVFVAAVYLRMLPGAPEWQKDAREILCREIEVQTYPDGCGREQAFGYHLFILQFFLFAGIAAKRAGYDFPPSYWQRLEEMLGFAAALAEGGPPPMFGDCDDGYVLDLGAGPCDVHTLLCIGAVLFGRADFKALSGGFAEGAWWLFGKDGRSRFEAIPNEGPVPLGSRAFRDGGVYLLQCGRRGEEDRISVVFDCGELGYKSIAAHGHADALSFTLRAFGIDIFVDPGTYDYFKFPEWRDYFRSTRAHNTLLVDGEDQSVMLGRFLWGNRATARCVEWEPDAQGGKVAGEHDGYRRLKDGLIHRRIIELNGESRTISVRDELRGGSGRKITICFHLSELATPVQMHPNLWNIRTPRGDLTLELDARLSATTLRGSEDPIAGWVSRGYHRKVPTTTIIGHAQAEHGSSFLCRIVVGRAIVAD